MSGEVLLARSLLSACEKELKKHLRGVRNASLLALSGNTRYTDGMKTPRPNASLAIPIGDGRDAVRRRPGGRSARVQVAVFEATIQLLEERGYERLSIASIAEHAGTHETSLYRRWNTKEQLILEALDRRVAQEIPVPDTGTLRSDLVAVLQSLKLFLQSREGQALFQTAVATLHVPELRASPAGALASAMCSPSDPL